MHKYIKIDNQDINRKVNFVRNESYIRKQILIKNIKKLIKIFNKKIIFCFLWTNSLHYKTKCETEKYKTVKSTLISKTLILISKHITI